MNIVSVCGGDTIFPTGIPFSLVNNVWGIQYSRGYRIHYDTGLPETYRMSRDRLPTGFVSRHPFRYMIYILERYSVGRAKAATRGIVQFAEFSINLTFELQ